MSGSAEHTIHGDGVTGDERRLERGAQIHRFVILDRLGAGAMGVVYSAYDPELDRKVAIKLLLPTGRRDRQRGHMLREAKALAKLSHPNVVVVHDVGEHRGQIFIAMEFVEGSTLTRWLQTDEPRPFETVLAVFDEAGKGLAAAHAAGLVHRDFKPDNVMVGDDGRVRVMDFGLARPSRTQESADAAPPEASVEDSSEGGVVGTPAYMSPEQFYAAGSDALSDQFSFCVALYEALYGERPFSGASLSELMLSITDGKIEVPERRVPGWVRKVVLRGLKVERDQRFESIDGLLDALRRDPSRARRRWLAVAAGIAVVGSVIGADRIASARTEAGCDRDAAEVRAHWNDETAAEIGDAFARTDAPYKGFAWSRTSELLHDYARSWSQTRREACLAGDDAAARCLEDRRLELAALLDTLAAPRGQVVRFATSATSQLNPPQACAEGGWARDAVEFDLEGRRRLAEAMALRFAGRYEESAARSREALDQARKANDLAFTARAQLELGWGLAQAGHYAEAVQQLEMSYYAAGAAGSDQVAATAAVRLVDAVGNGFADPAGAQSWIRSAQMMLERQPVADPLQRVELLQNRALVAHVAGDSEDAISLGHEALDGARELRGKQHPSVAGILNNLGLAYDQLGRTDEARDAINESLRVFAAAEGDEHPDLIQPLINLGHLELIQQRLDEARRHFGRALALGSHSLSETHPDRAKALNGLGAAKSLLGEHASALDDYTEALDVLQSELGSEHPTVGSTLANVGNALAQLERFEEATDAYRRSLAVIEAAHGADHPSTLNTRGLLATALLGQGKYDEALATYAAVLAAYRKKYGEEHLEVAFVINNLGDVLRARGEFDEAAEHYEQSLSQLERFLGPDNAFVAYPLTGLGLCRLEGGDREAAETLLRRALSLRTSGDAPPEHTAETRFGLARALERRDRPQARALAKDALLALRRAARTRQATEVDAWLVAHP